MAFRKEEDDNDDADDDDDDDNPPASRARQTRSSAAKKLEEESPSGVVTIGTNKKGRTMNWRVASFEEKLAVLAKFVKKHNHCQVPKRFRDPETDFFLGSWVFSIRRGKCRTISSEQKAKLEQLAFTWNSLSTKTDKKATTSFSAADEHEEVASDDEQQQQEKDTEEESDDETKPQAEEESSSTDLLSFEERLERLKHYSAENGHVVVPQRHVDATGFRLGYWVRDLRKRGRECLNKAQKEQLDRLQFVWNAAGYKAHHGNEARKQMSIAREEHDNNNEKKSSLTTLRHDDASADDDVDDNESSVSEGSDEETSLRRHHCRPKEGSRESPRDWRFVPFEEKLDILKRFAEANGHVRVPQRHVDATTGFKLGRWVYGLRSRKDSLDKAHKKKLERLNFLWRAADYQSSLRKKQEEQQRANEESKQDAKHHTRTTLAATVATPHRVDRKRKAQVNLSVQDTVQPKKTRARTSSSKSFSDHGRTETLVVAGDKRTPTSSTTTTKTMEGSQKRQQDDNEKPQVAFHPKEEEDDDDDKTKTATKARAVALLAPQFSLRAELDAEIQRLERKMERASTLSPEQLSLVADEILQDQHRLDLAKDLRDQSLDKFKSLEELEREKATLQAKYNATEGKISQIKQRVHLAQELSQVMERCKQESAAQRRFRSELENDTVRLDPSAPQHEQQPFQMDV